MTRRCIIAGLVLLAAIALAAPLVPTVWQGIAYKPQVEPCTSKSMYSEMVFYRRRWSWVPVPEIWPDQMCNLCGVGEHRICMSGPDKIDGWGGDPPSTFRCTCTDPSHDGD